MSDSKVLVFGSFTEDEIRSLKRQDSGSVVQPLEKKELQFGSLDFASVRSLASLNGQPSRQPDCSEKSSGFQPSNLVQKDVVNTVKEANNELGSTPGTVKKKANHELRSTPGTVEENGSIHNSSHFFPLSNGVKEQDTDGIEFSSLCISKHEPSKSSSPKFHVLEEERSTERNLSIASNCSLNEMVDDLPAVVASKADIQKALNGPIVAVGNLLPRGLINSGNLCFLNATLQALLSCAPFVQLVQDLRSRNIPKVGYPTLSAFVTFIIDFDMPPDSSVKKKEMEVIETGRPFIPAMFESILKNFTPDVPNNISGRPRQEDAQEFLSFVMDEMHSELLKLEGQASSLNGDKLSLVSSTDDDGWETVGRKNKSAVTRTQSFVPSKLSAIFGGQLRSVVKARGNKASATVQPFLLLYLDIFPEAVHTIEDALCLFSAPESLEGYRASAAGKAGVVSASKSVKIQTLSKIMILHLMRFSYGRQGSTKLLKPVRFPLELVLGRELLVSPSSEGRKYELVATITHHGKEPSKGHYTADTRYADGQWLRYDDASITAIGPNKVLHDQAYVLFYKQVERGLGL